MLFGQLLENFVAIELTKQLTFSEVQARLYRYHTTSGQEIDFILEGPGGKIVAIEVKATSKTTSKDFRHLEALAKDLGDQFQHGFVIYQGKEMMPFGNKLHTLPLTMLWQ